MDKNVTDQEQRYLKYMGRSANETFSFKYMYSLPSAILLLANLDELQHQDTEERELYQQQIEELNHRCQERQEVVDRERLKFMEFKKQVGLAAVNSRSGKPIPPKVKIVV